MSQDDQYRMQSAERTTGGEARSDSDSDRQMADIRNSIEHTRGEMGETIGAIQERLSPTNLKEQVKEKVRHQLEQARETVKEATVGKVKNIMHRTTDSMNDIGRTMIDTIKNNPIPVALVGIGVAWIWWNAGGTSARKRYQPGRTLDDRRNYYWESYSDEARTEAGEGIVNKAAHAASDLATRTKDTVSSAVGQVQQAAGDLASKARESASGLVDQTQKKAGQLVDQARNQARRLEDGLADAINERPLAVAAAAVAVGAAVGLAIPRTQKENRLMGEARDALADRAKSVAEDTMEQASRIAEKVTDDVVGKGKGQEPPLR